MTMNSEPSHTLDTGDDEGHALSIPVETFFDEGALQKMWPDSLTGNAAFLDQIEERKKLIDALQVVQKRISNPTRSFEDHLSANAIQEEQIAGFYEALVELLERTPEYGRIILYLPFEYLLSANFEPATLRLAEQTERLRSVYMQTWERLLRIHDVRANFVDGDVLETDKREGDLQRVVKAAHFIPFLVQKGWVEVDDVVRMHEESEDGLLKQSIVDACGVLCDLNLADEHRLNMYGISVREVLSTDAAEPKSIDLERLQQEIDERLGEFNVAQGDNTDKRQLWLEQVHREGVIEAMGDRVHVSLRHNLLTYEVAQQLLIPGAHIPSQLACIEGLRKAIEAMAADDMGKARSLYRQFHKQLELLWKAHCTEVQPFLQKFFFRLHNAGVIDAEVLSSFGLVMPAISGPFPENVRRMDTEVQDVQRMIDSIRSTPALMEYVYPVVLMYGSKVKGYGAKNADTDLAVFIRPNTPEVMMTTVREMLAGVFTTDSHKDPVTEFWLQEDVDGLAVHEFDAHDRALGSSLYSHVLFGAAWSGDTDTVRALYADVLAPYFMEADKEMYGRDVRALHLESLEQDLLQYRLMHKGYARYYPSHGGMKSEHAESIDGQSTFWDSGYRAVATKLFIERVFLPRL